MMNYGNPYMPLYNPNLTPQQRLAQMEQQYPQFTPQVQNTNNGINVMPVSSVDEARAFIVDIQGTPTFFYNSAKGEVYLKQTNKQTGSADFKIFALTQEPLRPVEQPTNSKLYEDKLNAIQSRIDGLYEILAPKSKKEVKNAE